MTSARLTDHDISVMSVESKTAKAMPNLLGVVRNIIFF